MLRRIRRYFEILLMLAGVAAIVLVATKIRDDGLRDAAAPPWSVGTLDDFRKWRPQYDRAVRLETGGSTYYLVLGERARVLASEPAGYLFDARGSFLAWTLDIGDEPYLRVAIDQTARKGSLGTAEIPGEPAGLR